MPHDTELAYPVAIPAANGPQGPPPDTTISVTVHANMTAGHFRSVMGPDADIREYISVPAVPASDSTKRIHTHDVLSCENPDAMQTALIQAVLWHTGDQTLTQHEIAKRARDWTDISPEATLFLTRQHQYFPSANGVRAEDAYLNMKEAGLSLRDFLRPAGDNRRRREKTSRQSSAER